MIGSSERITPSNASIAILGVPFDNVSMTETIAIVERMIASKQPHYIATANVDFLVQSLEDIELRRILFDADLVVCDGTPLVWASGFLGNQLKERVAGSDLVPRLLQAAAEKGYRVFFLGGKEEVIETAIGNIRKRHPQLEIAGYYSPPFAPLLEMDHEEICRRINDAKPDMCFVSFGCPKQEKWIWMNRDRMKVPMSIGVGATVDFLAGTMKRAPMWMRKIGLEWLFRMLQEPGRLVKRYAKDFWVFGFGILRQLRALRLGRSRRGSEKPKGIEREEFYLLELPDRLDVKVVKANEALWEQSVTSDRKILLVDANVTYLDSTGAGLFVRLAKMARENQVELVLVSVSQAVMNAFELMQIKELFHMTERITDGLTIARQLVAEKPAERSAVTGGIARRMAWKGEVTAVNIAEVWEQTEKAMNAAAHELVIDISGVRFIDSSGAGLMVKVKKAGVQEDLRVVFHGAGKEVLNVLKLTRLDKFLLTDD